MPSIEEMDAQIAHMEAFNKKIRDEMLAEYRAELETTTNPYVREQLREHIANVIEIDRRTY